MAATGTRGWVRVGAVLAALLAAAAASHAARCFDYGDGLYPTDAVQARRVARDERWAREERWARDERQRNAAHKGRRHTKREAEAPPGSDAG